MKAKIIDYLNDLEKEYTTVFLDKAVSVATLLKDSQISISDEASFKMFLNHLCTFYDRYNTNAQIELDGVDEMLVEIRESNLILASKIAEMLVDDSNTNKSEIFLISTHVENMSTQGE